MPVKDSGAARAEERERIAALLSRYPALAPDELEQVKRWFRNGASALDLGLLASDPEIARQYRAYRAEHYDRITASDWRRAALFVASAVAVVGGIAAMMP